MICGAGSRAFALAVRLRCFGAENHTPLKLVTIVYAPSLFPCFGRRGQGPDPRAPAAEQSSARR